MKKSKVLIMTFIIGLILFIFYGCVKPRDLDYEESPNPIPLTEEDIDLFGNLGTDEVDLYNPVSIDFTKVESTRWIIVSDRLNKNLLRFNVENLSELKTLYDQINNEELDETEESQIKDQIKQYVKATRIDYENEGVPISVSSDTNGNIFTISQLAGDTTLEINIRKYELDENQKPLENSSSSYPIYPVHDSSDEVLYGEVSYNTSFYHITSLDVLNSSSLLLTNHSTYTITTADEKLIVPPEINRKL